jgi:tryptophan synthase alpha chain
MIQKAFEESKSRDEACLIPYITAGFPSFEKSFELVEVMDRSGADIIEVGVPFSDPIADGPAIQYSSQIALKKNANLRRIIAAAKNLKICAPLVMMSYLNPLLAYGVERLYADMYRAGFSGIIVPDLPVDDAGRFANPAYDNGVSVIFLVAPTSTEQRIKAIVEKSRGFIYVVSVTGVTGTRRKMPAGLKGFLTRVRSLTEKPVAVGFGISSTAQIDSIKKYADGVIVGSRIIEAIKRKEDIRALLKRLKESTRLEVKRK